jgi:HEAT repeat protein
VRGAAALAIARLADTASAADLAQVSADEDPRVRARATRALRRLRDPCVIPTLIDRLVDPDLRVSLLAAGGLVVLGEASVGPLVEAFEGDDAVRSAAAAMVLERLGFRARSAVPALLGGLGRFPAHVALALRWHQHAAPEAVPRLRRLLRRKRPGRLGLPITLDFSVAGAAAVALARLSPGERTARRLIEEFQRRQPDDPIAFEVMHAFRELPPAVRQSQHDRLRRADRALRRVDEDRRHVLRSVLDAIERERDQEAMIEGLRSPAGASLVAFLTRMLDPSTDGRLEAALAMEALGCRSRDARRILTSTVEGAVLGLRHDHGAYMRGDGLLIETPVKTRSEVLRRVSDALAPGGHGRTRLNQLMTEAAGALDSVEPLVPDPLVVDAIGETRDALRASAERLGG